MLNLLEISLMCAVVGYVYAEVLIRPKMILFPVWKWLCRVWLLRIYIVDGVEVENESWMYKPMGGCYKCVTGQLGFWSYLTWCLLLKGELYHAGHHAFVICLAILGSIIIEKCIEK